MIDDVVKRLDSYGYAVDTSDTWVLPFIVEKVENHLKNRCNIREIPGELYQIAVDMVCGYFLQEKKAVNPERLTGFDLDAAVKQISEGDTSVTFALGEGSTTPEQRLDTLVTYLITYGEKELVSYRCIKW